MIGYYKKKNCYTLFWFIVQFISYDSTKNIVKKVNFYKKTKFIIKLTYINSPIHIINIKNNIFFYNKIITVE